MMSSRVGVDGSCDELLLTMRMLMVLIALVRYYLLRYLSLTLTELILALLCRSVLEAFVDDTGGLVDDTGGLVDDTEPLILDTL